jgi:hypothetical protein
LILQDTDKFKNGRGKIAMKKRILKVSKLRYNESFVPKIRLSGLWLNKIGFMSGNQVEIDYSRECLKLNLFDPNSTLGEEKSYKLKIFNSSGGKDRIVPEIRLYGLWLGEIGFKIEDKILVTSDFGVINIALLKS